MNTTINSVESFKAAAHMRFGCPEKADTFMNTPQPAYLGHGPNNTPLAQAQRGNFTTVAALLRPAMGG